MKFENAKKVLTEHAYKLAGELFTNEANKIILKAKIEDGNEEAKEQLNLIQFTENLFGGKNDNESEELNEFWEMIQAVGLLEKWNKGEIIFIKPDNSE